jgi:magnesium transporter
MPAAAILNDPVSKHLRTGAATLRPDWTVADALAHLRANPPAGRIIYFYVTDGSDKLVGVVPTRRLLLAPPGERVDAVMIRGVVAVPADATVLEACEFFTLHRLLAFPVVDTDRRLLGVIDVELYTDELAHEDDAPRPTDDVFELIGVHRAAASHSPQRAFLDRFPWLLCNVAGGLTAAVLSGLFEDVLTWRGAAVALFIPVVLALSESVAMQSVTLTVGRLKASGGGRGWAELATGGLLGVACASLVAVCAGLWLRDPAVGGILLGAIWGGVLVSAGVGFAVPTLLHRLELNPHLAAGPVALAVADMLTLAGYFLLARAVMQGAG